MIPRTPPEKIFQTRWRIPSIFTPSFADVFIELFVEGVSDFGADSFFTGGVFFTGTDFVTTFFGAGEATTGAVFFGATFSTLAFDTTFFAGTVFFATGDFSCVDAFFVGLFFVWVFIREILGKDFRKSKISSLFDIFLYNANIYSLFILFPCLIKISHRQKNA
mgnify:CR=1 FL=1